MKDKTQKEINALEGRIGVLETENKILRDSRAMWIKMVDERDKCIKTLQDAAQTTYKSREEWEKAFHEVCAQRDAAVRIRDNKANRLRQAVDRWIREETTYYPKAGIAKLQNMIIEASQPAADETAAPAEAKAETTHDKSVKQLVEDVELYRRDAERTFAEFQDMKQLRDKAVDKLRYIKQLLADVS